MTLKTHCYHPEEIYDVLLLHSTSLHCCKMWQKLRDLGGASSLRPAQTPKLKLGLITSTWLRLIISKIFIILHHPYSCYVYTLYNLFAHSSCTFLLILLFIKSTVYCPAQLILFYFFYSYAYFFLLHFLHTYIYVYSLVCVTYNCIVHGADLNYISLLVIFCIIVYVTNKILNPWILVEIKTQRGQWIWLKSMNEVISWCGLMSNDIQQGFCVIAEFHFL